MLSVDDTLVCKRRNDLKSKMEIIWVQITTGVGKSIYIGCAYINFMNHAVLDLLEESLDKVMLSKKINDAVNCNTVQRFLLTYY